jgi:hypothetical protein
MSSSSKSSPKPGAKNTLEEAAKAAANKVADEEVARMVAAEEAALSSAKKKLHAGTITQAEYEQILQMNKQLFDTSMVIAREEEAVAAEAQRLAAANDETTDTAARAHESASRLLAEGAISPEEFAAISQRNDAQASDALSGTSVVMIESAFMCPVCMKGFASGDEVTAHFASH